jgi:hypothetical protein
MLVWLLGFSLKKEAIDEKKWYFKKKEWKRMRGWSLDPHFMTLITIYMNSLAPK